MARIAGGGDERGDNADQGNAGDRYARDPHPARPKPAWAYGSQGARVTRRCVQLELLGQAGLGQAGLGQPRLLQSRLIGLVRPGDERLRPQLDEPAVGYLEHPLAFGHDIGGRQPAPGLIVGEVAMGA